MYYMEYHIQNGFSKNALFHIWKSCIYYLIVMKLNKVLHVKIIDYYLLVFDASE